VALARVIWGVSKEEELAPLVERLVAESGAAASDVLVVSDCDAVHVAAARGCRLEYVPEREGWLRALPDGDYERFLEARGRGIRAAYRIGHVELPDGIPAALSRGLGEEPA
jgi:hypothetical protein